MSIAELVVFGMGQPQVCSRRSQFCTSPLPMPCHGASVAVLYPVVLAQQPLFLQREKYDLKPKMSFCIFYRKFTNTIINNFIILLLIIYFCLFVRISNSDMQLLEHVRNGKNNLETEDKELISFLSSLT